ncbi:unnamed protein product [Prorocentrum cordatum]|uniref:Uncharacterized protein n=1 Tax=Prorocentrum cordatum TaxID=2364126 RepID=A0ABN9PS99_9DINO|nr:unnamed protein product [Polarella glacialis]
MGGDKKRGGGATAGGSLPTEGRASHDCFPRVECAAVSAQCDGKMVFIPRTALERMSSDSAPPGDPWAPSSPVPPGLANCIDEGWRTDLRTMLLSGISAALPNRQNGLATSWSASGRAEAICKTLPSDTLKIIGCGIPLVFLKQDTWK